MASLHRSSLCPNFWFSFSENVGALYPRTIQVGSHLIFSIDSAPPRKFHSNHPSLLSFSRKKTLVVSLPLESARSSFCSLSSQDLSPKQHYFYLFLISPPFPLCLCLQRFFYGPSSWDCFFENEVLSFSVQLVGECAPSYLLHLTQFDPKQGSSMLGIGFSPYLPFLGVSERLPLVRAT